MTLKLSKRLVWLLFAVAMLSLMVVALGTAFTIRNLNGSLQWVAHTQEVLRVLNRLESDVAAAESEQLDFTVTPASERLSQYRSRVTASRATLVEIRSLIADNPDQTKRLNTLTPVIEAKFAEMDEAIKMSRAGESEQARQIILEKGARLRDQIRNGIEELKDEEKRLLTDREARSEIHARRSMAMLSVGTLFILALILVVFYELRRDLNHRAQLDRTRERFLNVSLDMLCIAGFDGYFKRLNPAWESTLGFTINELQAVPFIEFIHPDDRELTRAEASAIAKGSQSICFQNRYRCKDGSYKWLAWTAVPDTEEQIIYAVARDVSDQREGEETLRKQALTDDLTGLFNRRGFEALAEQQIRLATRDKTALLLAYIDVDYLKQINDKFGHHEGSRAIIAAAKVISESFRLTDIAARLGGDEFAVLLIDASSDYEDLILRRLQENVARYNELSKPPRDLSLSIGFSRLSETSAGDLHELMVQADAAMYEQKRAKGHHRR